MTKVSDADEMLIRSNIELTIKCEDKDIMLEGFRQRINALEYELNLANSYSNMSNLMLKKEAAV